MTITPTALLSLPIITTGTESGTWGDVVDNGLTSYLDIAIAGGLAISITTANVTLANTAGTSSSTAIGSTTAQYAILNVSGAMTAARSLILPSSSKIYVINNSCTGGYVLTVKGAATTGVTMRNGESAQVAWDGTDFVKVSSGTSTQDNTFVGSGALARSTGYYNTAVGGNGVLSAAGAFSSNTGVGWSVLQPNTGNDNTGIGALALSSNIGGSNNTGVGRSALGANTSGTDNAAVGYNAGGAIVAGQYNVAIGSNALNTINNFSGNTAVGYGALSSANGLDNSTALGYLAGYGAYGDQNTFLGANSGSGVTSGTNNTVLGSYTGSTAPISATGSNWIVLSDGAGTARQVIDSAGNATFGTGAVVVYAPTPAAISTTATLTNANLQTQLINTTGTSYTITMPLGSTLDTLVTWFKVDVGYDFSVINTASGTITMAVNTGVTSLGALTITTGTSAQFRIRRTAASTYIMYRIS